jgi:hypothetical protein
MGPAEWALASSIIWPSLSVAIPAKTKICSPVVFQPKQLFVSEAAQATNILSLRLLSFVPHAQRCLPSALEDTFKGRQLTQTPWVPLICSRSLPNTGRLDYCISVPTVEVLYSYQYLLFPPCPFYKVDQCFPTPKFISIFLWVQVPIRFNIVKGKGGKPTDC